MAVLVFVCLFVCLFCFVCLQQLVSKHYPSVSVCKTYLIIDTSYRFPLVLTTTAVNIAAVIMLRLSKPRESSLAPFTRTNPGYFNPD